MFSVPPPGSTMNVVSKLMAPAEPWPPKRIACQFPDADVVGSVVLWALLPHAQTIHSSANSTSAASFFIRHPWDWDQYFGITMRIERCRPLRQWMQAPPNKNDAGLRGRGLPVEGILQASFLSAKKGIQLHYQGSEFLVIFLRNDLLTQGFEFSLFFEGHCALSPNWGYLVHRQNFLLEKDSGLAAGSLTGAFRVLRDYDRTSPLGETDQAALPLRL